jgi:DnaJ-class molecular chaperone
MASNSEYQRPGSDSFIPSIVDASKLTYYQILGVHQGATEEEIIKAYRKKARIYHLNKSGSALSEELIKKLNEAKAVLLSEERDKYDEELVDDRQVIVNPAGCLPQGM